MNCGEQASQAAARLAGFWLMRGKSSVRPLFTPRLLKSKKGCIAIDSTKSCSRFPSGTKKNYFKVAVKLSIPSSWPVVRKILKSRALLAAVLIFIGGTALLVERAQYVRILQHAKADMAAINARELATLNARERELLQQNKKASERLDGYASQVSFVREQTISALKLVSSCGHDAPTLTNPDLVPPLDFQSLNDSGHALPDGIGLELLGVADLTYSPNLKVKIEVRDGKIFTAGARGVEKPEFHDVALLGMKNGVPCKISGRFSFLPQSGSNDDLPFKVVSVMGRRGYNLGKFSLPYGTDFRSDNGHLLVSDCLNALVQEFALDGQLVNVFGAFGNFNGKFNRPAAVKFSHGKIYVVEENNSRFQVFTPNGDFIRMGGAGSMNPLANPMDSPGYFRTPLGIAVDKQEDVIVVDHGNSRIQELNSNGRVKFIAVNKPNDPFQFKDPYYVTIDPATDDILVSNRGTNEIVVLSPTGKKVAHFDVAPNFYPG
jgi:hypothetical protein